MEIISPEKQLTLFGYKDYFRSFTQLYIKNKMPNIILLSGLKGLGKATFAYHFINFILSIEEEKTYSTSDLSIDKDNRSYKLLNMNIHPNFFILKNN